MKFTVSFDKVVPSGQYKRQGNVLIAKRSLLVCNAFKCMNKCNSARAAALLNVFTTSYAALKPMLNDQYLIIEEIFGL